jgi:hypothetical protein
MSYEPTIDRTTLLQGPAHIIFDKAALKADWQYLWCNGSVTVSLARDPKPIAVAGFGPIDDPAKDEWVEIDFTPAGNFSSAVFDWMFSGVFAKLPGASIFASDDTPCYIHTLDGYIMEVANARVVQFPTIRWGAGNPRFEGSAKIVGVIKKSTARTTAGALYTEAVAEAFTAVPLSTEWLHTPCLATWALAAPLTIMTDDKGWTLKAAHTLKEQYNPDVGRYDYRVGQIAVEASCRPININDRQILGTAIAGASRAIGAASPNASLTLAEDYGGLTAVLYGARLASKSAIYGEEEPRAGELLWRAYHTTDGLAAVAMTPDPGA